MRYPAANAPPTITTSTKNASANTLTLSPRLCVVAGVTELCQKIERARDDDGPLRARQRQRLRTGLTGVSNGVDIPEIGFGAGGKLPCRECPGIRRLGGDEARAEDGKSLEHQLRPLVLEHRGDDDPVLPRGQPRQQVAEAGEVVGAVPDLERVLAPPLEAARQGDGVGSVRIDLLAEKRLRRGDGEREVAHAGDID